MINKNSNLTILKFTCLVFFSILMASCSSSSSDSNNDVQPIEGGDNKGDGTKDGGADGKDPMSLVTRLVETDDTGETFIIDYTYEGTRLIEEKYSDGSSLTYKYENDKLIGSILDDIDNLDIVETYTYDSENRINSVETKIGMLPSEKVNLSYNADNTIISSRLEGKDLLFDRLTFSNGNIEKIEDFDDLGELRNLYEYTYDSKSGAFKNVEFREVFETIFSENIDNEDFGVRNVLTEKITNSKNSFSNESNSYIYSYNKFGYPIEIKENLDGDITTVRLTYNTDK